MEVEEYVEAGDRVVAIGRTGATFDVRVAHVRAVRNEKAIRFEADIDTPDMPSALGIGPRGLLAPRGPDGLSAAVQIRPPGSRSTRAPAAFIAVSASRRSDRS